MDSERPNENKTTPNSEWKPDLQTKDPNPNVPLSSPPPELPASHERYDSTFQTEKDWWGKYKRWAELFGVLLLTLYTAYTVGMYYVNRDAANAAKDAATAAKQNIDITKEQVHVGQRAYLVFQHTTLADPLAVGSKPHITIELVNSGQTPAVEVTYRVGMSICASRDLVPLSQPTQASPIGAGKELKINSEMLRGLTKEEFDAISIEEVSLQGNNLTILQQGPRLFFVVIADYKDVFGGHGETTLCSAYSHKVMSACLTGNDMKWEQK